MEIVKLTYDKVKKFHPEACDREIQVRIELDECYKIQSQWGRGLDLYPKMRELDTELLGFIAARQ